MGVFLFCFFPSAQSTVFSSTPHSLAKGERKVKKNFGEKQ